MINPSPRDVQDFYATEAPSSISDSGATGTIFSSLLMFIVIELMIALNDRL
ncbi:MAG: hypothetical protein RQ862_09545 [Candidatus Caldarchaeales archaeon]|nr:hypothetical protein [Candidatus Caldarchaeales archaeon]